MSKKSTTPLADVIVQNLFNDHRKINNSHSKYIINDDNNNNDQINNNNNNNTINGHLISNDLIKNGLPHLFTEIDINGKGHYFEDDLKRPYCLYDDGKLELYSNSNAMFSPIMLIII